MAMTLEQERALAIARARRRRAEASGGQSGLIDQASTNDPANELGIPVFNRGASVDEQKAVREQQINKEFAAQPWYGKLGQAVDDTARLVVDGASMGFADRMDPTGTQRQMTEDARTRAGWAGTAAEAVGAVAPMGLAAKAGLSAQGMAQGVRGMLGTGARTAGAAVDGALYGAGSAIGHDTDVSQGAMTGALAGAAGKVAGDIVGGTVSKVAGAFNKRPKVPDLEAIKEAAQKAYARADQAGVIVRPEPLQRLSGEVQAILTDSGYHPTLQPRIAVVLGEIDRVAQGNVTLKGIDQMRKIADTARASLDPSEKRLGTLIVQKIDDMASNLSARDVLTGDPKNGVKALMEARDLWRRVKKGEQISEAVVKAERRADSTGSGGNVDNTTRQNIRAILDNPAKRRGYSKDEIAAMEQVVRGTAGQNALRLVGKLAPTGVVSGVLSGGAGYGIMGPWGLAVPLIGQGAKSLADLATGRNVAALERIVRAGGDRAAAFGAPNAVQRFAQGQTPTLQRLGAGFGVAVGREN